MGHPFVQALEEILHTEDVDDLVDELREDKIPSLSLIDDAARRIEVIREKLKVA